MTYEELTAKIKSGAISGMFFFYGEERFLLDKSVDAIRKKAVTAGTEAFNLVKFEGKNVSSAEILASMDQYPQMSPMKLIIVKNSGILNNATLTDFKLIKSAQVPSDTCLIFIEGSFDKKKLKNLSFIEEQGGVVNFSYMPFNKLTPWVEKIFKASDKEILDRDVRYIFQLCGQSMTKLSAECEKLILYMGDRRRVSREDIDASIEKTLEFTTYNMVDDIMAGSTAKAYEQLKYLLTSGEEPLRILSLIMTRLSELLMCKLLKEDGLTPKEMSGYFDFPKPDFAINKTITESRNFSEKYLKQMIDKGLYYDLECKQGRLNPKSAVEMYLADLSSKIL